METVITSTNKTKRGFRFAARRVLGDSMYPTLEKGQLVVVKRRETYYTGDVIIFRRKGKERIKRISGVENDYFFVLGDNPNYSKDSRDYGYISKSDIIGKVVFPRLNQ